ncbi:MAG: CDP-diacylglycerol--glycerol-3-phosphate 3-phosphatidyltransferase [Leptolyngbyaceae cyanobacterium bins.59]|nr:CDP-diacylglycerol--glycerol-3-phosphate 3-phosphatidyltransferase [Leptolyngbyaceae cyanobacterium bins.59]
MNLPIGITLSRLLGVPFVLYLLHHPTPRARWLALGIFLAAAGTDWLDGYLARRLNQITDMGKFLDPLVDKFLVLAPLLALVELGQVPAWGVFLILARELAISGWRINPALSGGTQIQGANWWGKVKTVVQMGAIAVLIAPPLFAQWDLLGAVGFWVSVALTLASGVTYIWPQPTDKVKAV